MNISPSARLQTLQTQFFASLETRISALKAAGKKVIRLDIGSPDMPPASGILDALWQTAQRADVHGYQPHRGSQALLDAWAQMYQRTYHVDIDPQREIVPLLGSKEGIFHFTQAYVNPGDVVLVPNPGYLTYESAARFAGGVVYYMPLLPENDYLPDLKKIPREIAQKAKIMWLNYPNNPTAAVTSREFFQEAVEFAHRHQIILCHDAAYAQVTYDGYRTCSVLEVESAKDVCVEFNTLSKSHNMAGWRVGAALGNPDILKNLYTLKTQLDSSHFKPILEAAIFAMTSDQSWLQERNLVYQKRRDKIIQALTSMGFNPKLPKASLYVWLPIPDGWTSELFCQRLLEDCQVSLTPGTVFGSYGEGFVRISVCADEALIEEAMQRMQAWVGEK
ncbi:MAG: aminotransferase class I/II-fold pyridoxal phosphate-dependent enzyme [Anaerolineales bacterium]